MVFCIADMNNQILLITENSDKADWYYRYYVSVLKQRVHYFETPSEGEWGQHLINNPTGSALA